MCGGAGSGTGGGGVGGALATSVRPQARPANLGGQGGGRTVSAGRDSPSQQPATSFVRDGSERNDTPRPVPAIPASQPVVVAGEGQPSRPERPGPRRPDAGRQEFLGAAPQEFIEAAIGQGGDEFRGYSPFRTLTDVSEFYRRRGGGEDLPAREVVVENQPNAPQVGGGAPGVGAQGFGERALIGGDATIALPTDPQSPQFVTGDIPAASAPSDVALDPNYVEPSPNTAIIVDQPYNMPITQQGINLLRGFSPNDPRVGRNPGGPISRNLSNQRTGFGRRFS